MARPTSRQRLGAAAEQAVVEYVRARGYLLVARNLRVGRYELDLVIRDGAVVAVVEVRTRSARSWTTGFGSMDREKRLRIRRAGERLWRNRYENDPSVERMRFDAASVVFGGPESVRVEYAVAAF